MRSFFLALSLLPQLLNAVPLWEPTGEYQVGFSQHVFNHTTPNDPTLNPGILLLSVYYPTLQAPNATLPWVDAASAQIYSQVLGVTNSSNLSTLTTTLQPHAPALSPSQSHHLPTLLFGPGAGAPTVLYTAYLTELASRGFTLIAIDHPGEAPYISLPDNLPGVPGLPSLLTDTNALTPNLIHDLYAVRVADILTVTALLPSLSASSRVPLNTTHLGLFGHSLGGTAATGAIIASLNSSSNSPFLAAANIDGTFQHLTSPAAPNSSLLVPDPSLPSPDLRTPALLLAAEDHFRSREDGAGAAGNDSTWKMFNDAQSGWLRDVQVAGTTHLDYTDLPLVVDVLGMRAGPLGGLLGRVSGEGVTGFVGEVLGAFFGGESVDGVVEEAGEEVLVLRAKN